MLKLARFLKPYKKQVIAGPIFKLIEAVFELIVPLVMANVIDIGVKNNDGPYTRRMGGGLLLLLGVVGLCSTLVCQYFASIASQGFGTELRNKLFRHINTFSYAEVDKFGTPSLITRLTNDVNQMQQAVAMLIRLVIGAPFLAAGAIVMAMLLDLKMSLIFLVAAPFLAGVIFLVMNRSIPFYRGIQKKLDRISLISRENLSGARVILGLQQAGKREGAVPAGQRRPIQNRYPCGKDFSAAEPGYHGDFEYRHHRDCVVRRPAGTDRRSFPGRDHRLCQLY